MFSSSLIAPALPEEVEIAEAAFAAKCREIGPFWGEADEAALEVLAAALRSAYDRHNVAADDRRVDV